MNLLKEEVFRQGVNKTYFKIVTPGIYIAGNFRGLTNTSVHNHFFRHHLRTVYKQFRLG